MHSVYNSVMGKKTEKQTAADPLPRLKDFDRNGVAGIVALFEAVLGEMKGILADFDQHQITSTFKVDGGYKAEAAAKAALSWCRKMQDAIDPDVVASIAANRASDLISDSAPDSRENVGKSRTQQTPRNGTHH